MNSNGKVNSNNAAPGAQQVQVNPVEVAKAVLVFLARVEFKAAERQMFDLSESLLRAIVEGQVVIAPPPPPPPQADVPTIIEQPELTQ